MASTNKTTHYELSQYVGSDKPTYLTDYNTDMSNIDTGIYNAQTKADSGYSLANTADGKADTAITNAGIAQTNASTALTNIGTMANLETTTKSSLVGAINEVNTSVNKFNLNTFTNHKHTEGDITSTQATFSFTSVWTALNSDDSIGKVYGLIDMNVTDGIAKNVSVTVSTPELSISDSFTVSAGAICQGTNSLITAGDITYNTNNTITITYYSLVNGQAKIVIPPCITFLKDFGDTPIN